MGVAQQPLHIPLRDLRARLQEYLPPRCYQSPVTAVDGASARARRAVMAMHVDGSAATLASGRVCRDSKPKSSAEGAQELVVGHAQGGRCGRSDHPRGG